MSLQERAASLLLVSLLAAHAASGQQAQPSPPAASNRITLDVVVTEKSGTPVADLQQQDFTVFDNKVARPITSFQALGGPQAPIEVVLLIDAVNTTYINVSYEREQIDRFLRANDGRLLYPTSLAIFTDTGTQMQKSPSRDGNALSASLDQLTIGLRDIRRDSGFYGADDRRRLSLNAIQSVVGTEAARPGRKIILWVSPGWPLLSGPGVYLDSKQSQQLFSVIADMSTEFRRAQVTLYSIDPLGPNQDVASQFYYEEFLKGVTKPSQVQLGDLSLQVLAVQSGGRAISGSNDVPGLIERCIADASAYYEISFDPPPADHPNEYHQLEIKVSKPGLTVRTRSGYYAQPATAGTL